MCLSLNTVCTASDDSTFRSVELLSLTLHTHTQPNPEHQPFRLPLYCQHGEERIGEERRAPSLSAASLSSCFLSVCLPLSLLVPVGGSAAAAMASLQF